MLCVLVMMLPILIRLPAEGPRFAGGSFWLYAVPPVWFMGLERWLLTATSAERISVPWPESRPSPLRPRARWRRQATPFSTGASIASSFVRHMARLTPTGALLREIERLCSRPVFVAIRQFTMLTLRRSILHQGIVVALSSAGAGLVINSVLGHNRKEVAEAIMWAPFPLMFVGTLAVRMAFSVPVEQRANWIFRVTERADTRADQLDAALYTVRAIGIVGPILLVAPFSLVVLDIDGIVPMLVALLCGWLLVEILMKNWRRIPFTCSYIPGKQFVPQSILRGFASFVGFTMIGWALARLSAHGRPLSMVIDAVLLAAVLITRQQRVNSWSQAPLAFEDQLPTEVNPLRLSLD